MSTDSVGLTAGVDAGFRLRGKNLGATFYLGLGTPLFFAFDSEPPGNDKENFLLQNALLRAIDIGMRIDIFNQKTR
jgi:hypothetical protein